MGGASACRGETAGVQWTAPLGWCCLACRRMRPRLLGRPRLLVLLASLGLSARWSVDRDGICRRCRASRLAAPRSLRWLCAQWHLEDWRLCRQAASRCWGRPPAKRRRGCALHAGHAAPCCGWAAVAAGSGPAPQASWALSVRKAAGGAIGCRGGGTAGRCGRAGSWPCHTNPASAMACCCCCCPNCRALGLGGRCCAPDWPLGGLTPAWSLAGSRLVHPFS